MGPEGLVAPGLPINGIEAFGAFTMANAAAAAEAGPDQPARGAILSCVYEGLRLPMDRALEVESHYFRCLLGTEAVGCLIAARYFLRQRMAKRGLRKADPADPVQAEIAARLTSSIRIEAERMLAEAVQANVIRNAALRRGLPVPVKAATVRSRSPVAPATLDQIAGRLLTAGAEALAADEDQDLANFAALELAGFPEWTGVLVGGGREVGTGTLLGHGYTVGMAVMPDCYAGADIHRCRAVRFRTRCNRR